VSTDIKIAIAETEEERLAVITTPAAVTGTGPTYPLYVRLKTGLRFSKNAAMPSN
jgi:hypothetical protein